MPANILSANIQKYINSCSAANAYSASSCPREYSNTSISNHNNRSRHVGGDKSTMPRHRDAPLPPPSYSSARGSTRRSSGQCLPPDLSRLRIAEEPPPSRPRPSRRATPPSPGPPPTRQRRKSVRFDAPTTTSASSGPSMPVPQRPKTFATDAPPAAISESAKQTARRLYHRKDSDGGPVRSSARPGPGIKRSESTWTLNSTRAEAGTTIGGPGGGGGGSRKSRGGERERERKSDRPSRRR